MRLRLKKLGKQVVVITGATSGIGLVTARMAARRGARLVLAARNERVLRQLVEEIREGGGEAVYAVADVGKEEDVHRLAELAHETFGGFDTWVNNAGVSIYGRAEEVSLADHHRLFETNYWGVVHGSLTAIAHLREHGGALINVGSVLSERAIPMQGPYCASKHAVKGFTEALRMEIEAEDLPVAVTLVKPSAVDTPYEDHARNYLERAPKNPPPIYAPEVVARAILHCAEHPERDVTVGGGGRLIVAFGKHAPKLTDKVMERTMFHMQMSDRDAGDREKSNLYDPLEDGQERSRHPHHALERSLYTDAALHPLLTGMIVLGAGCLAAVALFTGGGSTTRATEPTQALRGGGKRR